MIARLRDRLQLYLLYAARSLGRNPGFTAVSVLCLALGIGANTTMFGVVDALLFRAPVSVRDPGDLLRVYFSGSQADSRPFTATSFPNYSDLAGNATDFSAVAAYSNAQVTLGRGPEAQQLQALMVTANYFSLLGVRPALGRFFSADEDGGSGARVAVLSYGTWRRQFGGSRSVLGRTLWMGGALYFVVGVAPSGFTGVDLDVVDVWLPIRAAAVDGGHSEWLNSRGTYWIDVVARLRPGATRARAAASATIALRRGNASAPFGDTSISASLYPVLRERGPERSEGARTSIWVAAAAAVVLVIACANLAGLMLARSAARRREMAIRLALGAGRAHLVAQLAAESGLLAALGGMFGVLLAWWGGSVLRTFLLPQMGAATAVLNVRVLAFTASIAVFSAFLSCVLPALEVARSDVSSALKSGSHVGALAAPRGHSPLIVGQVALALVLVVGTGLFVRSLQNVRARIGGLDVDKLLMLRAEFDAAGYAGPGSKILLERMRERLLALPGIRGASLAVGMPLRTASAIAMDIPGSAPARLTPYIYPVDPDWFKTAGTAVMQGRGFTDADRAGAPRVAVVNVTMANAFWPGESAIGKCLLIHDSRAPRNASPAPCTEVVGVAADVVRLFLRDSPDAEYYVPLEQNPTPSPPRYLLVRSSGNPDAMVPAIRRAVRDVATDLPFVTIEPLEQTVGRQLRLWRMGVAMFGVFAVLGLLLASVGLYGLLSFVVARRTPEMAVRMALGAEPGDVLWLMVRQGLRLALVGVVIGVPGAIGVGRALASVLYGVSASDPALLAFAAALLLAVAGAASYVPARRATRVDPALALRAE